MANENTGRSELDKLLSKRKLSIDNADKEIFPLVDHFIARERTQESEIDCDTLLETILDTESEVTELSYRIEDLMLDDNELSEYLKSSTEFNMKLKKSKRKLQKFLEYHPESSEKKKLFIWFTSSKLSLNIKKTKYTFFHKNSVKDNIPLKLPDLHIFDKTIERTSSIKLLGVMLDENITWSNHINIIEKKIAKNIGLLYKARALLNKESLKIIYFSYMHSYLNYANIAWASTYFTKLKTIHYQQKHAARIIFYEDILTHSRPLLRSLNALNVYQINLYQHANFMYKFKNNQTPKVFDDMFEKPSHKYPTRSSEVSYTKKKFSLNSSK